MKMLLMLPTIVRQTLAIPTLFLCCSGLISLCLGALLPNTNKPGIRPGIPERPEGVLGGLVVGKLALGNGDGILDWQAGGECGDGILLGAGGLDLLDLGITLGLLAGTAGEEDKAFPVLLKTLDVDLEGLLVEVLAAGVDGNTDGGSELAGDTSSLLPSGQYYGTID